MKFVCMSSEIKPGEAKRVEVDGRAPLAVFNLDGKFFVTDDTCTHGDASLCDGEIDGDVVECPYHQGAFEIATGKPAGAPCTIPLRTYLTQVTEGQVFARLDGEDGNADRQA